MVPKKKRKQTTLKIDIGPAGCMPLILVTFGLYLRQSSYSQISDLTVTPHIMSSCSNNKKNTSRFFTKKRSKLVSIYRFKISMHTHTHTHNRVVVEAQLGGKQINKYIGVVNSILCKVIPFAPKNFANCSIQIRFLRFIESNWLL
jgi:hypothetical protein